MSSTGYEDLLEKYRDVDEDAIMSGLTEDQLAQLDNEIDREILEKPPDIESEDSDVYTTTSTDESSDSEEEQYEEEQNNEEDKTPETPVQKNQRTEHLPTDRPTQKGKPEAFSRGKLDRTQLKPIQRSQMKQKSGGRHTFKLPALKKAAVNKADSNSAANENKGYEMKNELIQAVSKRDKRRCRRTNSSGIGTVRRLSGVGLRPRRNSKIIRYRDGNEHQVDAAIVNRNFITDEMKNLRPRLRKVEVKEPKLVLPEELHGVSFKRITSGAKKLQDEEEGDAEAVNSEDGDASRNSAFGGYDADNDVTPSLSDESYAVIDDDCDNEDENKERQKALSECSETPSDGVMTMASTASTSAESCDVFGELSINPNSVEEMIERVNDNDPMLTEVNLNNIHDVPIERFEELAEAMESNTCVTSLLLANTGLTDRAARAMSSMLKKNKKLKILNLESNFITGEGARRLVSALRKNDCLIELLVDNQRHIFGAKVEFEIAKLLKENKSLLKFGYQFANPGPRMSTSNILTKNMDIVRKRRVAEEKKRVQAGLPKRPTLRRQPSSEWYRQERLQRLKSLQDQSKLLGLDLSGNIGDVEVEKVLHNMNPEEVSLLERWFTSKLLGMVDTPPTAPPEHHDKVEETPPNEETKTQQNRGREEKKKTKSNLTPVKNNLLRPPSKSPRRSKSPVANRGDLMDSIRNQNAKLKKVQIRPFESPTRMENTDSDSSDVRPARISDKPLTVGAPEDKKAFSGKSQISGNEKEHKMGEVVVRPTILRTEPSIDKESLPQTANHGSHAMTIEKTNNESRIESPYTDNSNEEEDNVSPPMSSSPEVREWKEGEEYDSDEYEIVEMEVTDTEEDSDAIDDVASTDGREDLPQTMNDLHATNPASNEATRDDSSPVSRIKNTSSPTCRSPLSARIAKSRPEPFGRSTEPNPYAAVLNRQASSGKPEVYDYLDSRRSLQSGSNSPRNSPLSPGSSRSSPRSPGPPSSPLSKAGSQRLGIPTLNRSISNSSTDSSRSTSSNKFPKRPLTRSSRLDRSKEDDLNICPKAMSTIESFFSFK